MPDISPSIPTVGQPNSTEEPKIVTALTQLVAAVNNVDDAQMANPNNAIWRTLQTWDAFLDGGSTAGLYFCGMPYGARANGSATFGTKQYPVSAADSAVAGKTTKYRWLFNYVTNGVAPGQAITLDLRAVTGLTGASFDSIPALTLGAAQPGPAVTFTPSLGLGASSSTAVVIADGTYTLGITLAGTTAATSYIFMSVSLQMQHV